MNGQDTHDQEPGFIFQRVARQRLRLTDKRLQPHNLTSPQAFMLNWLVREDGLTQKELAKRLGVGTVAVSGMVDRLEAAGMVSRAEDPNDRRAKTVWLKASARASMELLSGLAAEINSASFKGMTRDEVRTLLSLMARVSRNLAEALEGEGVPHSGGT